MIGAAICIATAIAAVGAGGLAWKNIMKSAWSSSAARGLAINPGQVAPVLEVRAVAATFVKIYSLIAAACLAFGFGAAFAGGVLFGMLQ